jgi:hypothetical protein
VPTRIRTVPRAGEPGGSVPLPARLATRLVSEAAVRAATQPEPDRLAVAPNAQILSSACIGSKPRAARIGWESHKQRRCSVTEDGMTAAVGLNSAERQFAAGGFSLPAQWCRSGQPDLARSCPEAVPGPRVADSAGRPRARVPGPGNPRPAVTASAGQCDWGPWAAPSSDLGTPRPPWAANPGVFPQPTFAIEN